MTDFGDKMMDFLFDNDAGDQPTAEIFQLALDTFKENERDVRDYFMIWVWTEWCAAHLPPPPEPTQEELDRMTARALEALEQFWQNEAKVQDVQKG